MRLLLDTNIFLEILLEQERATDARQLLARTAEHSTFISDFSLHSIGLMLFRTNQLTVFQQFLDDILLNAGVRILSLAAEEIGDTVQAAQRFSLDFDDAYQYAIAGRYALTIVSFDGDFDRTDKGRQTPDQIVSA